MKRLALLLVVACGSRKAAPPDARVVAPPVVRPDAAPPLPGTKLKSLSAPVDAEKLLDWERTAEPETAILTVDGHVETASALQHAEKVLRSTFERQGMGVPPDAQFAGFLTKLLDDRIEAMLLRAEADTRGFKVSEDEIDRAAAHLYMSLWDATGGILPPLGALVSRAEETVLIEKLLDDVLAPTDADLELYLEKHRAELTYAHGVHLYEVLVLVNPFPLVEGETREGRITEARDRAEALAKDLVGLDEATFAVRARELSDYPVGSTLGWSELEKLPPQFSGAVAAADPGTIVGPLESPIGFHIFRVNRKQDAVAPPMTDLREILTRRWRSERARTTRALLAKDALPKHDARLLLPATVLATDLEPK